MTNTETDSKPKTGRRIVFRLLGFVATVLFIITLAVNLQLILLGDTTFPPIAWAIVSAIFLISDAVRSGIGLAISELPIRVATGSDDTPQDG